jgi:hypothetical protein
MIGWANYFCLGQSAKPTVQFRCMHAGGSVGGPATNIMPPAGLQAFSGSVSALFCVWFSPVTTPHGKCGANLHPGRAEQLCTMLCPEFG